MIPEQKSKGGIVLAVGKQGNEDEGCDLPKFGRVISHGAGWWDLAGCNWIDPKTRVKEGDYVLLSKTGDYSYTWNGERRLITKTVNIIGTLTREEALGFGFPVTY